MALEGTYVMMEAPKPRYSPITPSSFRIMRTICTALTPCCSVAVAPAACAVALEVETLRTVAVLLAAVAAAVTVPHVAVMMPHVGGAARLKCATLAAPALVCDPRTSGA